MNRFRCGNFFASSLIICSLALTSCSAGTSSDVKTAGGNNSDSLSQSSVPDSDISPELKAKIPLTSEVLKGAPWGKLIILGERAFADENYDTAERYLSRAFQETQNFKKTDPRLTRTMIALGKVHLAQSKASLAELDFRRSLELLEADPKADKAKVAATALELGRAYAEQNKYNEARQNYTKALSLYEQTRSPTHPNITWILEELAAMDHMQGRYELAEPLYKKAIAIHQQKDQSPNLSKEKKDENKALMFASIHRLADVYVKEKKYSQAEFLLAKLISQYQIDAKYDAYLVPALLEACTMAEEVAKARINDGNINSAKRLLELAQKARQQYGEATDPALKETTAQLEQVRKMEHKGIKKKEAAKPS